MHDTHPQIDRSTWPDGANQAAGKPVTTCPRCGAMSSGGHVCEPRRTR